jgi:hypothetical protein
MHLFRAQLSGAVRKDRAHGTRGLAHLRPIFNLLVTRARITSGEHNTRDT